jgi:hypothetical protein
LVPKMRPLESRYVMVSPLLFGEAVMVSLPDASRSVCVPELETELVPTRRPLASLCVVAPEELVEDEVTNLPDASLVVTVPLEDTVLLLTRRPELSRAVSFSDGRVAR